MLVIRTANFNRNAFGSGGASAGGAASSPGYNALPRPSPGASALGGIGGASATGNSPFNRGFPFGASSLPPHLAGFANAGAGTVLSGRVIRRKNPPASTIVSSAFPLTVA